MRRTKWYLLADERPFNSLGCPSSGSRATAASLEGRADGPTLPHATRRTDFVELRASGPTVPALHFRPSGRQVSPRVRPSQTLPDQAVVQEQSSR